MDLMKKLRAQWRRTALLQLERERYPRTPPPRSHYKFIMKWAKKHNLTYLSGERGAATIYRGNERYARIHFRDWGRHVVGWVRLRPDMGGDHTFYFGVETPTIKDALRVLNQGLKPEEVKHKKRIKTERPKFKPQKGGKREGHLDRS